MKAYRESTANLRNEAGADAAALECQDICETLHKVFPYEANVLLGREQVVELFAGGRTDRSPFHPTSFDVSVEDVESDVATVALVDKGEDLPRVIWIIEDA